ncbi:MAG: hypothetical protein ACRDNZ_20020 [Streptosporangiaceae bacterium]
MTTSPAEGSAIPTVQPIAELFTGAATAFWATTYSIDLGLFNEFLLPRLGEPPLNVAVLADQRRLAASLERIPAERVDTLASVNRRWLLRGVQAAGAFHPKSYLAVSSGAAVLLVGSGNLSAGGLDDGRELFTTFRSGTPVGNAAIDAWRSWARRIVSLVSDTTLAERFQDLEARFPPPLRVAATVPSPLLDNLNAPIADQVAAAVTAAGVRVQELWLTAPFYDPDAAAVAALIDSLRPRHVHLLVTNSTSVNGDRLAERLCASGAQVRVDAYQPERFVHAKLIGIAAGPRAWLLSGSANLSRAALTLTPAAGGNIELAVLAPMDADLMRATFIPPSTTLMERSLDSLVSLAFRSDPAPGFPAVRLLRAAALHDGRIEVTSNPPFAEGWLLDDLTTTQPLIEGGDGRAVTAAPLLGRLLQIVSAGQQVLSNRVVADDPTSLAATLTTRPSAPRDNRPAELAAGDLATPLGQALTWLHRHLVMDVSERATATAGSGGIALGEAEDQADENLWVRLEREQISRDPRADIYTRILARHGAGITEPIIEFLEGLRARVPGQPGAQRLSLLARLLVEPAESRDSPERQWAAATRIRVRARNVLRRWAAAQADPRLQWVNPLAPAGNFAMIAAVLAHLRLDQARNPDEVELTEEDLDDLWLRWLRPFAGTGQGDGWLDHLDEATRSLALSRTPEWLPEAAAALCWLVVRPRSGYRERVVAFQPVLLAALDHGLLEPTTLTARYLSAVTSSAVSRGSVDDLLLAAATFIDDALWCERQAGELGLSKLKLAAPPGAAAIQVRLDVGGIDDPLLDPRVPRLVVAARRYRGRDGVALFAVDNGWRLVLVTGERVAFRPALGAQSLDSVLPVADGDLERLAAEDGVLADFFHAQEQVAS